MNLQIENLNDTAVLAEVCEFITEQTGKEPHRMSLELLAKGKVITVITQRSEEKIVGMQGFYEVLNPFINLGRGKAMLLDLANGLDLMGLLQTAELKTDQMDQAVSP